MTTFVLVPGAWLGGFAWERVSAALVDAGNEVYPVTLPGVGNRLDETDVGLRDHVDDIVGLIERADLHDVVLVGHSYSGIPVGLAALAVRDRVQHVVYVDAEVPVDGQAFAGAPGSPGWHRLAATLADAGGVWVPIRAGEFEGQDLSADDVHLFEHWATHHPGRTLTDIATVDGSLADVPTTYVKCLKDGPEPSEAAQTLLTSPHWRLVQLDTGHWPMWSQPAELAQILLDVG